MVRVSVPKSFLATHSTSNGSTSMINDISLNVRNDFPMLTSDIIVADVFRTCLPLEYCQVIIGGSIP